MEKIHIKEIPGGLVDFYKYIRNITKEDFEEIKDLKLVHKTNDHEEISVAGIEIIEIIFSTSLTLFTQTIIKWIGEVCKNRSLLEIESKNTISFKLEIFCDSDTKITINGENLSIEQAKKIINSIS